MFRPNYGSPPVDFDRPSPPQSSSSRVKSPFFSPRGSREDFGSSPWKNANRWRPHKQWQQRYYDNEQNFSPRGGGRGGHFRGGGHRGSPGNDADIRLFAHPSMLDDPWKELTAEHLKSRQGGEPAESNDSTISEATEESILTSDTSLDRSNVETHNSPCDDETEKNSSRT